MNLRSLFMDLFNISFIAALGLSFVLIAGCDSEDKVSPNGSNAENIDGDDAFEPNGDGEDVLEADADADNEGDGEDDVGNEDDVDNGGGGDEGSITLTAVTVTPDKVEPGDEIVVGWASSGADRCEGVGSLPGWQDQELQLEGPFRFVVLADAEPGDYQLGIRCSAGNVSETKLATIEILVPEARIVEFNISPESVVEDQEDSITVEWDSKQADTCIASGDFPGWSGNKDISGVETLDILDDLEPGDYTLALKCENSHGVADEKTRSFELRDRCADRKKLTDFGFTRRTNFRPAGQGSGSNFSELWSQWPGVTGIPKNVELSKDQFVSLKFNSGPHPGQNKRNIMHYDDIKGGDGGTRHEHFGTLLFVVSRCEDDFDIEKVKQDPSTQGKCVAAGTGALKVTMTEDKPHECKIEEDTDYYLNIVTTPGGYSHNGPPTIEEIEWQCANPEHTTCSALMRPGGSWPYVP